MSLTLGGYCQGEIINKNIEYTMKFDKIKILSNIKNISYINKNIFEKVIRNGRITAWHYKQETPFLLIISKSNLRNELIIEFTGKVLEERYPELINSGNIRQCLENINKLGICELKVDSILKDAIVTKCDVTCDVIYDDLQGLTSGIRCSIMNYNKYSCRQDSKNLTITKNVSSRNRKIRLVIYDKEKEMSKSHNKDFCARTGCDDFNGKIRFEMNLTSMAQIKEWLRIGDTTLVSVLNSSATPIVDFLNDIIAAKTEGVKVKSLRQYEHILLLEKCAFDMAKVQEIVRKYSSSKVSVKQMMKPFRELLDSCNGDSEDIRTILNQLLYS